MSSSRQFFLRGMKMFSQKPPKPKPYPIGRDHPRKQVPDCTNIRGPLRLVHDRVHFLINEVSDLDGAAKHARFAVTKRVDHRSTISTCNAIIGAMFDAGRSGDALDLFDFFFNESKVKPNIASCNLVIKSHCEQGRLDHALCLFNHLSSFSDWGHTPYPDHNTYDLLTKALVDAGNMDQALELLLKGREELFNFQEPAMYMNLIRGYLEQGNLDMAYQLRDDFKTCSIRNKIAVLNTAFVEYLFKQGKDEEAMALYRTEGYTINKTVGNAYLKVLLRYGKKTQASELFQYMLDNLNSCGGLNADTLNMMVNECFEAGQLSDAVKFFTETKEKLNGKVPPGAYRNLITRLCENGRLSEAESLFDELLKLEHFRKPDAATYTALIHAYIKSERVEDAIQTVNKMIAANFHNLTNRFL